MSNPNPLTVQTLVNHLDYLLEKVKETIHEAEGLRTTKDYLSQRLTESHQMNSRLIVERDTFQVQYEVLRDLTVAYLKEWSENKPGEALIIRLHEVLGLTEEDQPLDTVLPFTPASAERERDEALEDVNHYAEQTERLSAALRRACQDLRGPGVSVDDLMADYLKATDVEVSG